MRSLFFFIFLLSIFSCQEQVKVKQGVKDQKQLTISTEKKRTTPSLKTNNATPTLKTVFVQAKSGLVFRSAPHPDSSKLGVFDFGTKLHVVQETNIPLVIKEKEQTISGQWLKVKSRSARQENNNFYRDQFYFSGFVFSGFVADSSNVDFTQIPIFYEDISYEKMKWPIEKKERTDLQFSEITFKEFKNYQSNYKTGVLLDSTKETRPGSYFIIPTQTHQFKFSCGADFTYCHYYKGYVEALHSHVISMVGSGVEMVYLINKKNNQLYPLATPFDNGCEAPRISKSGDLFIAFASNVFHKEAFISFYKKDKKTKAFDLINYESFLTDEWRILDLVWVDDQSFALSVYEERSWNKSTDKEEIIGLRYLLVHF